MQRCTFPTLFSPPSTSRLRRASSAVAAALVLGLCAPALPSFAQTATFAPFQGSVRAFPKHALRGTLVVTGTTQGTIDGNQVLLAPAFKLYNQKNMLVRQGTVLGQQLTVNYVIEKTSGRVHAAWVLNSEEAALKRDRADNGFWSNLLK